MDKVSIITATFNCVDEIEISIKSVLEQDYSEIEYIIIDGASTDGTVDIIKKYEKNITYWISEPDDGLYFAMNKGIEQATGDWIYIHNAGNVFKTSHTISRLFNHPLHNIDVFYGYIFSQSKSCYLRYPIPFYKSRARMKIPGFSHQAMFARAEWIKKFPFDITFKCCADFKQMVLMYTSGAKYEYIDECVCISAPAGFSARNRIIQMHETAKINNIDKTLWFRFYVLKVRLKMFFKWILNKK